MTSPRHVGGSAGKHAPGQWTVSLGLHSILQRGRRELGGIPDSRADSRFGSSTRKMATGTRPWYAIPEIDGRTRGPRPVPISLAVDDGKGSSLSFSDCHAFFTRMASALETARRYPTISEPPRRPRMPRIRDEETRSGSIGSLPGYLGVLGVLGGSIPGFSNGDSIEEETCSGRENPGEIRLASRTSSRWTRSITCEVRRRRG